MLASALVALFLAAGVVSLVTLWWEATHDEAGNRIDAEPDVRDDC